MYLNNYSVWYNHIISVAVSASGRDICKHNAALPGGATKGYCYWHHALQVHVGFTQKNLMRNVSSLAIYVKR